MSLLKKICLVLVVSLSAGLSAQAVELLKIMPLGDSNTRGTYVADEAGPHPAAIGAGGYRYPLQQMLTGGGYRFDFVGCQTNDAVGQQGNNPPTTWSFDPTFDRDHQGLAGFTSAMLITGSSVPNYPEDGGLYAPPLVTCLSTYQPNIVLLMSGTNGLDPNNVAADLQSLDSVIRTITTNAPQTRVIVGTIFDRWDSSAMYNATQFYNGGISGLVTAAQQRGEHVSLVDTSGALTRDDFCYDGVMADGVHPNPLSLGKVAAVWYQGIERVAPLPEPSVVVLSATGLLGVLAYAWRKRK